MTWFLRKYNYWPSYNIPFLKKISDLGGFTEKANINNWWRWGYSPRAKIFQRDHNKVKDMETLRELMRWLFLYYYLKLNLYLTTILIQSKFLFEVPSRSDLYYQ